MIQEQPDSLDLIPKLEAMWEHDGSNECTLPPDWRAIPHVAELEREKLVSLCLVDIEMRVTKRRSSPPLAHEYGATAECFGLDLEGQLALIKAEFQWYRSKDLPVKKADYLFLFRGTELEQRIRDELPPETVIAPIIYSDPPVALLDLPLPVGSTIAGTPANPRFRLTGILGWGGMGVVYKAEDLTFLKRQLAIKLLKTDKCTDPTTRKRFKGEWEALATVNNPNVVKAIDFGEHEMPDGFSLLYLVLEYLEGETLADQLQAGQPLPLNSLIEIARGAVDGLAAIHEKSLIHRDIKPGNLKLVPQTGVGFRAVVMDLGLARSNSSEVALTQVGEILGTPSYWAPEQVSGGQVDHRTDLFSLGCTIYHMATGKPPFLGTPLLTSVLAVTHDAPEPPESLNPLISPALSSLIMKLMEKNPDRRYQSTDEVVEVLRGLHDGSVEPQRIDVVRMTQPVEAEQVFPESIPPIRRFYRWAMLSTAVVVSAALTLAFIESNARNRAVSSLPPETRSAPLVNMPQPGLPQLDGDLEVRINADDGNGRNYIGLDDPGALPLKSDDGYVIVATVNRPIYAYIFLIKPDGVVKPVYPWTEPGDWKSRPQSELPLSPLRPFVFQPPTGSGEWWYPPTGPAGMLTLIMLARETPLPEHEDVAALIGPVGPQKEQHRNAKVWFRNGVIFKDRTRPDRDPDFEAKPGGDPLMEVQRRVKDQLLGEGKSFTYSLAVSFATEGRPISNN